MIFENVGKLKLNEHETIAQTKEPPKTITWRRQKIGQNHRIQRIEKRERIQKIKKDIKTGEPKKAKMTIKT